MTKRFNPPMAQRLGAVAITAALAAFSGIAAGQNFVKNTGGELVRNGFGGCVVGGGPAPAASSACPAPATANAPATVAPMASSSARAWTASAAPAGRAATMQSAATGTTAPGMPGYAVASDGRVVLSGASGQCVRAGHWTAANAAEPCDRVARAAVPPPAPVAQAPEPPQLQPAPAPEPIAQAPAPVAQPEPPRPVIQKLTLSTDVLFDFGSAELKDAGKRRLDQLASEIKDANVDEIIAVGHADRIASGDYNQRLSEQRADAVKAYLEASGAKAQRVSAEGKGETASVTGDDCKKMGPERSSNSKLVACLQPDRRVEIEVLGTRQLAGEAPAAGTGATR